MKKFVSSLVCAALIASMLPTAALGAQDAPGVTGEIKATLRFDYPQRLKKVEEKNIVVTMYEGNREIGKIPFNGEVTGEIKDKTVTVKKNNEGGDTIADGGEIGYFDINVEKLPLGDYKFKVSGSDYSDFETRTIRLDDYSKQVILGTGDRTFSVGDVDNDGEVTKKDLALVEKALDTNSAQYDLNGDGKVNIIDYAYVNHQIGKKNQARITDTALIASKAVDISKTAENLEVKGGLDNIFAQNNSEAVELSPKNDAAEISIPIELKKASEMEQIEIISPDTYGAPVSGNAEVTYIEDGQEKTDYIQFNNELPSDVSLLNETETTSVTIKLGKRVAVKKIVINVTKVKGSDENPEFAVLQEVKFLKEIVPENPVKQTLHVRNVKTDPKNESVSLSWDEFPNITGYKVYYGENRNSLKDEITVDTNSALVKGLKNLKTYYFKVTPISDEWEGTASEIVSAVPQPDKVPEKVDMVTVTPLDRALSLSWKKTENAVYYQVFYKEKTADKYTQYEGSITEPKVAIGGLTNDVEYELYVVAGNDIGLGKRSDICAGTPALVKVEPPKIPKLHQIDRSNIEEVEMKNSNNVLASEYPNGFSVNNVADGDYGTHWTARAFWESNAFTFTFKEAKEMNYMVYVPRLDGDYKRSLEKYSITVCDEAGNEKKLVNSKNIAINSNTTGYIILPFEKTKVKKLTVEVAQWAGSPTGVSLAEAVFYESDNLAGDVRGLFKNDTYTELSDAAMSDKTTTKAKIEDLRAQANDADGYYVDKDILLDELSLAESLLDGDTSTVGLVKDGVQSRTTSYDSQKYGQAGSDLQPLGAVAYATSYAESKKMKDTKVTIYAEIPEGENVYVVPTQYFAEANAWQGGAIPLQNGRNVIEIPKLGAQNTERGGALYIRYSGANADKIKLQARMGVTPIPTLELSDWYSLTEAERKAKIGNYVDALEAHTKKYNMAQTSIFNATEISMPNVLLSVAAAPVLGAVKPTGASKDDAVNKLYNNVLAWEDTMHICNTTQGIDDTLSNSGMQSRQNIRYMRMFAKAFMYAAGSHIGIGYGSVGGMATGSPIETLGNNATSNGLFGWGIAHEIGHNMDKLGKAEITNNIYALMVQTYDGKANTLPSRLETSGKYKQIYDKVAKGHVGMSNDVFVQLGMYWQLHLAYDDGDNPMNFYNKLFKEWKSGSYNVSGDEKFALIASKIANKNLTEFFTSWGMVLSDGTKAELAKYPAETRKIQYLCDESRRFRLKNNNAASGVTTAKAEPDSANEKQVNLTFSNSAVQAGATILGYEIKRNGKTIAFVTKNSYTDIIGSANNQAFNYTVQAVDILGNKVGEAADAGQVRISYVKTIDKSAYTEKKNMDGSITVTMNKQTAVSGVKITNAPASGTFTVTVKREDGETVTAKNGDFAKNETPNDGYYVTYFNKPKTDDTRIWTYDAKEITVTGVPAAAKVEFISYAGDNIGFTENASVGRLKNDYEYDNGEGGKDVIKAGTLVVTGSYRGDPLYNTIQINGKFVTVDDENNTENVTERAIDGYALMFAEIPADGEVSDISDGIFIFVPNVQKEAELQGEASDCTAASLLPVQLKAVLYRTDDITSTESKRMTSDTIWIDAPSDSSMPDIILEGDEK